MAKKKIVQKKKSSLPGIKRIRCLYFVYSFIKEIIPRFSLQKEEKKILLINTICTIIMYLGHVLNNESGYKQFLFI